MIGVLRSYLILHSTSLVRSETTASGKPEVFRDWFVMTCGVRDQCVATDRQKCRAYARIASGLQRGLGFVSSLILERWSEDHSSWEIGALALRGKGQTESIIGKHMNEVPN